VSCADCGAKPPASRAGLPGRRSRAAMPPAPVMDPTSAGPRYATPKRRAKDRTAPGPPSRSPRGLVQRFWDPLGPIGLLGDIPRRGLDLAAPLARLVTIHCARAVGDDLAKAAKEGRAEGVAPRTSAAVECWRWIIFYNSHRTPTAVTRVMKLHSWGNTAGGSVGVVNGHRGLHLARGPRRPPSASECSRPRPSHHDRSRPTGVGQK